MRRDPAIKRLWMSYSWPHNLADAAKTKAVDIHLSHSDDDGDSWTYDGPLWTSTPLNGNAGQFHSHEVSNLYPFRKQDGSVVWVSVRLHYLVKQGAFIYQELLPTNELILNEADTPPHLAQAPQQTLSSAGTAARMNSDVKLASLSPDLAGCKIWNEPALTQAGEQLLLAVQCLQGPARSKNDFYGVFSTGMAGPIGAWKWKYEGRFLGPDVAHEFGYESIIQLDLAKGSDGTLLATLTPNRMVQGGLGKPKAFHAGCRIVKLTSLTPPAIARDAAGKIPILAEINSSDSKPLGPGACTYEPSSRTGVVIAHKTVNNQTGFTIGLYATGVRPK